MKGMPSNQVVIKPGLGLSDPPAAAQQITGSLLTGEHLKIFMDEIVNIKNRLNNHMAVFSQTDIAKSLTDIKLRFKRAEAFASVPNEGHPPENTTEWVRICSLDNKATIKRGFEKFMEQEKRLLSLETPGLQSPTPA